MIEMLSRIKAIGILAAIALAVVAFSTTTSVLASPCNLSYQTPALSGIVVRPPQITDSLSDWSFTITSSDPIKEVNGIVQGSLAGTFSATGVGINENSPVSGQWSYNKQTEKILIMLSGDGFRVDISILNLPSPGFTFSGTLYPDEMRPAMLVKQAGSISCAVQ
ncbi:MAG: hypothetical protein HYY67_03790 [Thaumarchaeota archaeon]|nr:hypothetical protein [Nitrososphaerota archaeon]